MFVLILWCLTIDFLKLQQVPTTGIATLSVSSISQMYPSLQGPTLGSAGISLSASCCQIVVGTWNSSTLRLSALISRGRFPAVLPVHPALIWAEDALLKGPVHYHFINYMTHFYWFILRCNSLFSYRLNVYQVVNYSFCLKFKYTHPFSSPFFLLSNYLSDNIRDAWNVEFYRYVLLYAK